MAFERLAAWTSPAQRPCVQDDRALRIFDRKGFFSVHGADTAVAAKLYGGSGVVKQLGRAPNQLASVTLNRSLYEQLLRTVLVESANRSVELYEGHGATWQVARCVTLFCTFSGTNHTGLDT